jgi:hypothetical protein
MRLVEKVEKAEVKKAGVGEVTKRRVLYTRSSKGIAGSVFVRLPIECTMVVQ